jgi:type IV secretion/conjugal transfer VirB4 family ATPase
VGLLSTMFKKKSGGDTLAFNLKRYESKPAGKLANYLPWLALIKPGSGIVLQRDGVLQRTLRYIGPDLESKGRLYLQALTSRINNAVKRLPDGWGVFWKADRYHTSTYIGSKWGNIASYLVDVERQRSFTHSDDHFEMLYHLTLTYKPPVDSEARAVGLFKKEIVTSGGAEKAKYMAMQALEEFEVKTQAFMNMIGTDLDYEFIDDDMTLTYLFNSIAMKRQFIKAPPFMMHLNYILSNTRIAIGDVLLIEGKYVSVVSIMDFPTHVYPDVLGDLNRVECEYSWVTRYLPVDKMLAQKRIKSDSEKLLAGHKGFFKIFMEGFMGSSGEVDPRAREESADAELALTEIGQDLIGFGHYSSVLVTWHDDVERVVENANLLASIINSKGFVAKREEPNVFEAWLMSLPGHNYANIRRYFINTLAVTNIIPMTSIWCGERTNQYFENTFRYGNPHVTTTTTDGSAFYLNLNSRGSDLGHTAVIGRSGSGKSFLGATLVSQWFKYPGAKAIVLDYQNSMKRLTLLSGGQHYEPGLSQNTFQPLKYLETDDDVDWAVRFIELLMEQTGLETNSRMKAAIKDAVLAIRKDPPEHRTLTELSAFIQYQERDEDGRAYNPIKQAIAMYLVDQDESKLFDGDNDNMLDGDFITIELEAIMNKGDRYIIPAMAYLFRMIEKRLDGSPVLCFIDEVWRAMRSQYFMNIFETNLRVWRKKRSFLVFATQNISEIANSSIAQIIIDGCPTKIMLPNIEATTQENIKLYKKFNFTESEIELIAKATPKRDYFIKELGGNTRMFQLNPGPLQLALFDASPEGIKWAHSVQHLSLEERWEKFFADFGLENYRQMLDDDVYSTEEV